MSIVNISYERKEFNKETELPLWVTGKDRLYMVAAMTAWNDNMRCINEKFFLVDMNGTSLEEYDTLEELFEEEDLKIVNVNISVS
jgi:hypothetical protein